MNPEEIECLLELGDTREMRAKPRWLRVRVRRVGRRLV
jgi:hypothetical protein